MNNFNLFYWLLGIVVLVVLILIGISEYFLHYALYHDTSDYNIETEIAEFKADYPYAAYWIDSIRATHALKDTVAMNRDGKKIHAWYLASPDSTAQTAIIVHGYTSNPFEMMMIGYMYHHDLHWNILLPDLVAHGQSEGKWIQMSWKDRFDVLQWCRVAHGIFPEEELTWLDKTLKKNKNNKRAYSFSQDAGDIYSAFLTCYGMDLTRIGYLHWWKFRTLFDSLPNDCEIKQKMY